MDLRQTNNAIIPMPAAEIRLGLFRPGTKLMLLEKKSSEKVSAFVDKLMAIALAVKAIAAVVKAIPLVLSPRIPGIPQTV